MPKAQLHARYYDFDAPTRPARTPRVTVPTFSLDSGLVFERHPATSAAPSCRRWSRARSTSTRRSATRTPAQLRLGPNDFNFATIYTENAFAATTASPTTTC
jgi:hypothetical protein